MSKINDGGAAFPGGQYGEGAHEQLRGEPTQNGMTLRDYFAAKAMQGLVHGYVEEARANSPGGDSQFDRVGLDASSDGTDERSYAGDMADEAYRIADEMIEKRRMTSEPDPSDLLVALKSMRIATTRFEDDDTLDAAKQIADRAIAKAEGRAQ